MKKLILAIIFCFLCVTQVIANESNEGFSIIFKDSHWGMSVSDVKKMMADKEFLEDDDSIESGVKLRQLVYRSSSAYGIKNSNEASIPCLIAFIFEKNKLFMVKCVYKHTETINKLDIQTNFYYKLGKLCGRLKDSYFYEEELGEIDENTLFQFRIYENDTRFLFMNNAVTSSVLERQEKYKAEIKAIDHFIDGYRNPKSEHGIMYRMLIATIKSQENYLEHGNWKQKRDAKHNMELCEEFEKLWEETVINCEKTRDKGNQETCLELIQKFNTKLENIVNSLRKIN